eukprot:TRINITY_DN10370_c0_g1_i1.p1 TRINITY_DN10370_c0_g1~~TRINITY_DN10370_c0_g1_i1.p1  ORF type:complete len:139 (+),score=12.33 TRINITY_DN10370_c0_g1_i1:92-508(+)
MSEFHAFRLKKGDDLKNRLFEFTKCHNIGAGYIATCVGSLSTLHIRLASAKNYLKLDGQFEICSLVGTLSQDGLHLHICVADEEGKMLGGHLMDGSIVMTTAEIVVVVIKQLRFLRQHDEKTGYNELVVTSIPDDKSD